MGLFQKIFQKKKIKRIFGKKYELKQLALEKIEKIEKRKFSEGTFNEFIFIFRVFMREIFNLKKQITHEEFILALEEKKVKRTIKNRIIYLSLRINEIEYENKKIDKEKFKELIVQFKEIINAI